MINLFVSSKISHLFDTSNNIGISCVSRNLYLINDTLQQEENNCQKTNKQTHTHTNKQTHKQTTTTTATTNDKLEWEPGKRSWSILILHNIPDFSFFWNTFLCVLSTVEGSLYYIALWKRHIIWVNMSRVIKKTKSNHHIDTNISLELSFFIIDWFEIKITFL